MRMMTWNLGALGCCAVALTVLFTTAATEKRELDDTRVELGRRLFFDPALSRSGTVSCASCHDPDHGFSDPRPLSVDETGPSRRHSQPLLDLPQHGSFHWDGEFPSLDHVLFARLGDAEEAGELAQSSFERNMRAAGEDDDLDPSMIVRREMGLDGNYGFTPQIRVERRLETKEPAERVVPVTGDALLQLTLDDRYDEGFRLAYRTPEVNYPRVVGALTAYLATIESTQSPYDRFADGDGDALTASAARGHDLFVGRAGCTQCHPLDARGRAISDGRFHNTGVAFRGHAKHDALDIDPGRTRVTMRKSHRGRFKTPSLRDVAKRAPYMHDGSFATLREVVDYYDAGGTPNEHLDPALRTLDLSDAEADDLVAFLEALSGDERPALGTVPTYRVDQVEVTIVDPHDRPLAHQRVWVHAAGDRLREADTMPAPFEVTTDAKGRARFAFPASTQVVLRTQDHEIGLGRPIPDWVESIRLTASPFDRVRVVLRTADGSVLDKSQLHAFDLQPDRADPAVVFERERTIDKSTAVFTTDARPGSGRRHLIFSGLHHGVTVHGVTVDLTGGESEPATITELDLGAFSLREIRAR